jgi:hypothetical protein
MLLYPCLSMEMGCWMPPSQMSLLRAESVKSLPSLLQAKEYHVVDKKDSPLAVPVAPRGIDILRNKVDRGDSGFWRSLFGNDSKSKKSDTHHSLSSLYFDQQHNIIRTCLSMTSRMSYFQDRLLAPESK